MMHKKQTLYEALVIGAGPSSEPVLHHLSKTNLKICLIDSGDCFKKFGHNLKKNNNKYLSGMTPKQLFKGFRFISNGKKFFRKINTFISTSNFTYIYSNKSGGLSNFWGGGAYVWPDQDLIKTTSIPLENIKNSYKNIIERIPILKIKQFSGITNLSQKLLKISSIFKESLFFINKKNINDRSYIGSEFNQKLIWNSSEFISKIIRSNKNINYLPNHTVYDIEREKELWKIKILYKNKVKIIYTKIIFSCAGTIQTSNLVFKALDISEMKIKLMHNYIYVKPVFLLNIFKSKTENTNILESPELSFSISTKNKNYISGYILTTRFIIKKLSKNFLFKKFKFLLSIINYLISHLAFAIILSPYEWTDSKIILEKGGNNTNINIINNHSEKQIKNFGNKLFKTITNKFPKEIQLIPIIQKSAIIGSDIHYAGTLPDKNILDVEFSTNHLGELNGIEGFYVCDPSRLSHLATLPHTLTSMAIVDASMPLILKKEFNFDDV